MSSSHSPADAPAPQGPHPLLLQLAGHRLWSAKLKLLGGKSCVDLDHVCAAGTGLAAALIATQAAKRQRRLCLLAKNPRQQERLLADLACWQIPTLSLPRHSHGKATVLADPDIAAERLATLEQWRLNPEQSPKVLVLCEDSLHEPAPAPENLGRGGLDLQVGKTLDPETLIERLQAAGYQRSPTVTQRGEFARRGGVLDVFGWQAAHPLRLEWLDEQLESLRIFDIHQQASIEKLQQTTLVIDAAPENEGQSCIADHLQKQDWLVAVGDQEPPSAPGLQARLLEGGIGLAGIEDFSCAIADNPLGGFDASDFVLHEARRQFFEAQLQQWHQQGWACHALFRNQAEIERFTQLRPPTAPPLQYHLAPLAQGVTLPGIKVAILSGAEILGQQSLPRRRQPNRLGDLHQLRRARSNIESFQAGELVVHSEHGIGRFAGLQQRNDEAGRPQEVLVVEYAQAARLFVPMAQAHLLSRYVAAGNGRPSLSQLGNGSWMRARKKAEQGVEAFAMRMLRISAERQQVRGHAHAPDGKWQRAFEQSFAHPATSDQERSIEEIKQDMESERPMDRLLCADVGFGKTEVAIRAAFKAVMGGKQVALLVPTTVLARQHWQTLRQRMSEFPVSVEMLCRLTPPQREAEILRGMREGGVDIVVGTHRLISKDVAYKDLGLVIIDEEQRFGVKHKERFKELFRLVDVLTLSATPIPRTLYLALMGMRDMSTIDTPPPSKQAVQTFIAPFDERLVRDAIDAELDRGGQIFYLHNRVASIEATARRIRELCPRARVIVGHGQMEENQLEDTMATFVEGRADVLVCTTIIESGVDIAAAGTILIDRADRFGLADLYQLRGRVGRSGQQAYAYLMLPKGSLTTTDARKRVNAMAQYTGLGSGFKIALRDLEIRGAGNLLGTEQSGHIAAVGFELYCQMLRHAVAKMQGRRVPRPSEINLRIDFLITQEGQDNGQRHECGAYLPANFLEDTGLRLQAYRQLGEVMTRRELEQLTRQWHDQFGERLPAPVDNLLNCTALRLAAAHAGISEVGIVERKLMLKRQGAFIMIDGRFPRLRAHSGRGQLLEALDLLRQLSSNRGKATPSSPTKPEPKSGAESPKRRSPPIKAVTAMSPKPTGTTGKKRA